MGRTCLTIAALLRAGLGRVAVGGAVVAALTCFMRHPILVFKSGALKAAQPFSPPHFV